MKWRSAAEVIDWSLPTPSIFESKEEIKLKYGLAAVRPLADNTQRRIIRGTDKFVIKAENEEIFIVPSGAPAFTMHNNENAIGTSASKPINTARTGGGGGQMVITPNLVQVNHTGNGEFRGQDISDAFPTITSKHGHGIATPHMVAIGQTGFASDRLRTIHDPVNTTVTKQETCISSPTLIPYHSEQTEHVRAHRVSEPTPTIDTSNRYGLTCPYFSEYYGNGRDGVDITKPAPTSTGKDRQGLTAAFLSKFYKTGTGQPVKTEPMHTITTSIAHFAEVRTYLIKWDGKQPLYYWPQIRELLNKYCDYKLGDDEILIIEIEDVAYFIADIGLRMLTPRELFNANGFPIDYIIEKDHRGRAYPGYKQVERCGNAVPPQFAEALVRANLPELCGPKLETMEELYDLGNVSNFVYSQKRE